MAVVQVLLGLCLASMAVAAPQLGSRRTVTTSTKEVTSSPDQIVSSVISSLQQPIALAVAEALRSLQTTNTFTTTGSSGGFGNAKSGFSSSGINSASLSSANTGVSGFGATAKSGYTTSSKSSSSSANSGYSGATGSLGLAGGSSFSSGGGSLKAAVASQSSTPVDLGPFVKPEYQFEYKVSDDAAQTYISMEEARDGTELTGSYSYVDANGALVTVNYVAGVNGYEETRDVQHGAVQITAQPVTTYEASYESSSSAAADLAASQYAAAQNAAAEKLAAQQAAAQRASEQKSAAAFRAQQAAIRRTTEKRIAAEKAASLRASAEKAAAQRVTVSKSSTLNSDALIAQILASLQPQIGAVVQNAIGATRSSTSVTGVAAPVIKTTSVQAVAAPLVRTSSVQAVSSPVVTTSSSQSSSLSSLFGLGGNVVRIATPKFQVEY